MSESDEHAHPRPPRSRRPGVRGPGVRVLAGVGVVSVVLGGVSALVVHAVATTDRAASPADVDAARVTVAATVSPVSPVSPLSPVPTTDAGAGRSAGRPTPTPPAPGLTADDAAAGLISSAVPESGTGELETVPGSQAGPGTGTVRSVRVEVEGGLDVDGARFADFVLATLNDPRGWGADGSLSFDRTDGPADLRVVLASPDLTDAMCAPLKTRGEVSCGRGGHATINLRRWVLAIPDYGSDRTGYRQYVVSHEVGHLLGHPHEQCPGDGELAPVMQQQSYGVPPCVPNPWPHPDGTG